MRIQKLAILSVLVIPLRLVGQTAAPDQTPPAEPPASAPQSPTPSPASSASPASPPQPVADRPVSWKLLFPNILSDQEQIWTFPARLVQGHDWIPTATILGTTAALIALDPTEGSYFRRTSTFHGLNNIFTSKATVIGTIAAPLALYGVGLIRKDSKMQKTALFAGEAVGDAEILTTFLKDATKRVRPSGLPPHGSNFSDTWFESKGSFLRGNGGFPSGHTIAAFSIATVVARRYRNHRWVPYAAYGMAALVGFSRLTLSAHFLSDVFVGGALGYSISRFSVLRQ